MRIMLVIGALSFGGAERVMANLANYLSINNEVLLCTLFERETPYKISEKVRVKQGLANNGKIKSFYELRKIAKEYRPDVVLSFLTQINIMTIISLLGTRIPVVVSERNDPEFEPAQRYRKILRKLVYPFASGYVFQTNDARKYFSKRIREKGVIIPNPVFVESTLVPVCPAKSDKELVAAGRLTLQKNYPMMIDAFSRVIKKHPEFILKIYGDGELKEELKRLVIDKEAEKNIFFMGNSKKLHEDILNSFGFIMSSDHEGMPNALLEAMSLGLCCISTDCPCGGPKEIINNGVNGILVPVCDSVTLSQELIKLIENEELAQNIATNGIKTRNKYSLERISVKWEKYLIECSKKH